MLKFGWKQRNPFRTVSTMTNRVLNLDAVSTVTICEEDLYEIAYSPFGRVEIIPGKPLIHFSRQNINARIGQ